MTCPFMNKSSLPSPNGLPGDTADVVLNAMSVHLLTANILHSVNTVGIRHRYCKYGRIQVWASVAIASQARKIRFITTMRALTETGR